MSKNFSQALFLLMTMMIVPISGVMAQAQGDASRNAETRKMLGAYIDVPSMDITPVQFSIGTVRYTVPRNYMVNMQNFKGGPQESVSFKVSFPGFKPYTEETKDCFTLAPLYRPKGCIPIRFSVIGSTPVSDDEAFTNASKLFHSQTPKQGPNGFEWYETGPPHARLDTYRKFANGHTLMIDCFDHDINRPLMWVCNTSSRLPSGNAVEYILSGARYEFNGAQFKYAEQLDEGLRSLVASFTFGRR